MPRPPLKRRKPNHKSPTRRVETPKNAQLRQKLDHQLANKPIGQRPVDSDDSDRLVTRTPNSAGANSSLRKEIYASGAVAKGDRPGAHPTRAQRRRNLQNDTAQIIKESRSRSQSEKSTSNSPAPTTSRKKEPDSAERKNVSQRPEVPADAPRTVARISRADGLFRVGTTPMGENSILGTLKPRKRQASILHMIDNEDSSIINPEDEDRFLPDDESTPLNNNNKTQATKSLPPLSSSSSSLRKRKFGAEAPELLSNTEQVSPSAVLSPQSILQGIDSTNTPLASLSSPQPRSTKKPLRSTTTNEDDIMALPQSSSPETTPRKHQPQPTANQKVTAISTKQLQSLMPSKRRRGNRERIRVKEFDIPADSSDVIEEDDDSVFLPKKRTTRGQRKTAMEKSSNTRKRSTGAKANSKKSTAPTTPRLVSLSLRTPMPLTRSINAENRSLRSPSQHSLSTASKVPDYKQNGEPENKATKSVKQPGGYRPGTTQKGRNLRTSKSKGAEIGQENLGSIRLPTSEPDIEDVALTHECSELENEEPEIEVGRGVPHSSKKDTDETSKWKSKWADIDDWSLDFEEVDASTESSSPLAR